MTKPEEFPCVIVPCRVNAQLTVPVWLHEKRGNEIRHSWTVLCPGKSGSEVLELLIKAIARCSPDIDWHASFTEHIYELEYQEHASLKDIWYEVARSFGVKILAGQIIISPPVVHPISDPVIPHD